MKKCGSCCLTGPATMSCFISLQVDSVAARPLPRHWRKRRLAGNDWKGHAACIRMPIQQLLESTRANICQTNLTTREMKGRTEEAQLKTKPGHPKTKEIGADSSGIIMELPGNKNAQRPFQNELRLQQVDPGVFMVSGKNYFLKKIKISCF